MEGGFRAMEGGFRAMKTGISSDINTLRETRSHYVTVTPTGDVTDARPRPLPLPGPAPSWGVLAKPAVRRATPGWERAGLWLPPGDELGPMASTGKQPPRARWGVTGGADALDALEGPSRRNPRGHHGTTGGANLWSIWVGPSRAPVSFPAMPAQASALLPCSPDRDVGGKLGAYY